MKKRHAILSVLLLVLAVPVFHLSSRVDDTGDIPEAWHLPESVGEWEGKNIFFSEDPSVQQIFRDDDILEPGVCPVSGEGLASVSPRERALLPRDVEIDRRLYQGPEGLQRHVIMLITGASREGIHRPDWCLVAQNVPIGDVFYLPVETEAGERFDVGVYPILARGAPEDSEPVQYFVYWFEGSDDVRTPYHWSRILRAGWDRLWSGEAQRWAYFSIQMTLPHGLTEPDDFVRDAVKWFVERDISRG